MVFSVDKGKIQYSNGEPSENITFFVLFWVIFIAYTDE